MKYNSEYGNYDVVAIKNEYVNGNLAIELVDTKEGECFGTLTVNLGKELPENYAFIDTNNLPEAEQFLKENELGEPTGIYQQSGFCQYPLYIINLDKVEA